MKAMILAAGRGERMRPLTDTVPKPLLEVNGKSLLSFHLDRLREAGICEVMVNASYRARQVQKAIDEYQIAWPEMNLRVSVETERLETGGGIFRILDQLGEEPFLVINGDVWIEYPLEQLKQRAARFEARNLAHLVLVPNPDHHPSGDFVLNADGVSDKVDNDNEKTLTFSGVSLLTVDLFKSCEDGVFPLGPLLRQAMSETRVTGECYEGFWLDVGTPQRLQSLAEHLQASVSELPVGESNGAS